MSENKHLGTTDSSRKCPECSAVLRAYDPCEQHYYYEWNCRCGFVLRSQNEDAFSKLIKPPTGAGNPDTDR